MTEKVKKEELSADDFDNVRSHYEKWPFPDISFSGKEGLMLLKYLHKQHENNPDKNFKIIDIGCGTGHGTIAIAKHFPKTEFCGVDISANSLHIATCKTKEEYIDNISFIQGDILNKNSLPNEKFDIVISTGVLHHVQEINIAFSNMTDLLKNNGSLILWLYGQYGRMKHHLNQAFIKKLSDNNSLDEQQKTAAEFLNQLGNTFALNSGFYTPKGSGTDGLKWLCQHKQWLADQMIPPYEKGYNITEILNLFKTNNILFEQWLGIPNHLKHYTSSPLLLSQFENLSDDDKLITIDYLIKPEYYFVIGKKHIKAE